ncbi:MAG TPA: hypothetical protein VF651_06400 [Gammaproteobacteria bacterium]
MWSYLWYPLGWLLRSSEYLTTTELFCWWRSNPLYCGERYGIGQWLMVGIGRLPRQTAFELGALQILLFINLLEYEPSWPFPEFKAFEDHATLVAYFSSPWMLQGTIVALTFPIVVVLIAFLFQKRDESDVRLRIYLGDSCALVVTVSSLSLALCMTIQYVLLWFDDRYLVQWVMVMDIAWFVANIAGTLYFLYSSFAFLVPESRSRTIRRYVFTVIWPEQVRSLFKQWLVVQAADDPTLLPEGRHSIYIGSNWRAYGDPVSERYFFWQVYLSAINFRILEWALRLWRRKLNRTPQTKTSRQKLLGQEPKLLLPVDFDTPSKGKMSVVRVLAGEQPGWVTRLLLWFALCWTQRAPAPRPQVEDLLEEFKGDVLEALHSSRQELFKKSYKELLSFIVLLIRSSAYSKGREKGNFALLMDRSGLNVMHQKWLRINVPIFDAATKTLKDDDFYFRQVTGVPYRLAIELNGLEHLDFKRSAVFLSNTIWWVLGNWWNRAVEDQGVLEHSKCVPVELKPPLRSAYNAALNDFVGSYETLRSIGFDPFDKVSFEAWPRAQDTTRLHMLHISQILNMVFTAVHRGDTMGAEAALDMLQRWADTLDLRLGGITGLPMRGWRLTVNDVIGKDVEEVEKLINDADDLSDMSGNEAAALVGRAIKNLWQDMTVLAALGLLLSGAECKGDQPLSSRLGRSLIDGITTRAGGTRAGGWRPARGRSDVLQIIFRQYSSRGAAGDYGMYLDQVWTAMHEIGNEPAISGRIYSMNSNVPDQDKVMGVQLLYLMVSEVGPWHPERQFSQYVSGLVSTDNEATQRLRDYVKLLLARVEGQEFEGLVETYQRLRKDSTRDDFEAQRAIVRDGLRALAEMFDAALNQDLANAEFDVERLREVEEWASATGFIPARSIAPVSMFRRAEYAPDIGIEHALTINKMGKGEFVTPRRGTVALNEQDWFDATVRDRVALTVTSDLITGLDLQTVSTASPEAYWEAFERTAKYLRGRNLTPVLLIDYAGPPGWLRYWISTVQPQGTFVPKDLQVTFDRPRGGISGYLATLNGVQVYRAYIPRQQSLMLPSETFDTIRFRTYIGGHTVLASIAEEPTDPRLVNLTLKWAHEIKYDESLRSLATRFMYGAKTEPEELAPKAGG